MTKYRMVYGSSLYAGNMYRVEKKTWYGRWVLETSIFVEGLQKPEEEFKRWLHRKNFVLYKETE